MSDLMQPRADADVTSETPFDPSVGGQSAARPTSLVSRHEASVYWYPPGSSEAIPLDVLGALRRYGVAETEMRKRVRKATGLNETDLAALHHLIQAKVSNESMGAKDLAAILDVSPASVSVMLDRLERSGYISRTTHPTDRRASVVVITDEGEAEVSQTLGPLHQRMLAVASSMPPEDAGAIYRFLTAMFEAVETVDSEVR